jgi:hypothetical protein
VLWQGLEREVAAVTKAALEELQSAGVDLVETDLPDLLTLAEKITQLAFFPQSCRSPYASTPAAPSTPDSGASAAYDPPTCSTSPTATCHESPVQRDCSPESRPESPSGSEGVAVGSAPTDGGFCTFGRCVARGSALSRDVPLPCLFARHHLEGQTFYRILGAVRVARIVSVREQCEWQVEGRTAVL